MKTESNRSEKPNTSTIPQSDMALINGEVHILKFIRPEENEYFLWHSEMGNYYEVHKFHSDSGYGMKTYTQYKESDGSSVLVNWSGCRGAITHSTASLEGVKQLNRDKFVKPVDVEEMAHINSEKYYFENVPKYAVFRSFIKGYNSNPAIFTMEQAQTIWAHAIEASGNFQDAVKIVRPLSLPASITIENDEIINVEW